MNRQKVVLTLLLIAFAGSLVYSYVKSPRQRVAAPTAAPATSRQASRAPIASKGAPAPKGREVSALHLDQLERERPRTVGFRRNIFSPIFHEEVKAPPFKPLPPPPKPVAKALPPPPPPAKTQAPPVPATPPPPSPQQLAEAEIAKITFLGFLKKNGEKTVFLSKNNEIFLAKKGSKVGPDIVVSDLTDDAITMKPVAGGREVVIPLVENRPLSKRPTSTSKWATPR